MIFLYRFRIRKLWTPGMFWDPVSQESGGGESRMESIVSGVLLIYAQLTGRSMEDDEFWEKNETFLCDIQKVHGRVEQDIF